MCEPTTLLIAMQAAGAASSANAAKAQSASTKAGYEYQAAVNRNNEQVAEWQAQDAIQRGAQAEQAQRLKVAQLRGTQRAGFAARGVSLDEGSPLAILQDTEYMGQLDVNTIRDNTAKEAWALRNQGANYESDAAMLSARAAAEDPTRAMFGSLLSSSGQVASSWYSYKARTK